MAAERIPRATRAAWAKSQRGPTPLACHEEWAPAPDRDPIALLERQAETRVAELVPIRHGRMLASPFSYYRGAALPMAADLAATPTSGITVQLCGDAHLSNFGFFGTPERHLVFDLNDFDETSPGPWEWDVKRLAASLEIAGRDNGYTPKQRAAITRRAVRAYRENMRAFANQSMLEVWYAHLDIDALLCDRRCRARDRRAAVAYNGGGGAALEPTAPRAGQLRASDRGMRQARRRHPAGLSEHPDSGDEPGAAGNRRRSRLARPVADDRSSRAAPASRRSAGR
jgi:hypothetical protein